MSPAPASNKNANKELLQACSSGDARAATAALARGANPDCRSSSGHTALMICCAIGQTAIASLLIEAGADADAVGGAEKCTALILSAAVGSEKCTALMLRVADPLAADAAGVDALKAAVWNGHPRCVEMLLGRCDPRARDSQGSDALCIAALRGDDACVSLLLRSFDPRSSGPDGVTALMCACAHGDLDCVSALLPGSDVHARDALGDDAAAVAAKNNNEDAALFIQAHLRAVACLDRIRAESATPKPKRPARERKPRG